MIKTLLATLLVFIFSLAVIPAFAQAPGSDVIHIGDRQKSGAIPGIPAYGNPNASPGNIVSNVIQILYAIGGMAVLLFIVWGAFDWITAGGDKDKIAGARRKIANALIGLALLALAAFIVSVFGQIVGIDPVNMKPLPTLDQAAP